LTLKIWWVKFNLPNLTVRLANGKTPVLPGNLNAGIALLLKQLYIVY